MQSVDTDQALRPFHRRHKNAMLLTALLLMILLAPLIQLFKDSKLLEMILTTLVVGASVNAISHRNRTIVYTAVCLATLAVIFGWVEAFYHDGHRTVNTFQVSDLHQVLSHSLAAILYMFVATLLFKVILIEKVITVDQIFAGVAIYVFIGLTWGHFYALTDIFHTESISGISVSTHTMEASNSDYMYFSFVTLTTLGYGDMFPVASIDKALAIIEAVTGVMFVAILVSTLVGRVNMKR